MRTGYPTWAREDAGHSQCAVLASTTERVAPGSGAVHEQ